MLREVLEIPAASERLLAQRAAFASVVERLRREEPRVLVACGRGSSGHAGLYLRYLAETRLGLLACSAAPSVFTAYRSRPDMRGVLYVVVSQSGRSPDLVATTEAARALGATTLAIVNDESSPVASAAELVLPLAAGAERSVAATKTVVASMIACAQIVAALAGDGPLAAAVSRMPERLASALACDWSAWSEALAAAPGAFVAARGYGLGSAREIALKLLEVLRLPAIGHSAAEFRHGPRSAVTPATPVLLLRQPDATAGGLDELARDLRSAGGAVFLAGGPDFLAGGKGGTLPWLGDGHPALDPVAMLAPAYRAIEAAARRKGLDPDSPPHLTKVTRTL
ncbi:SIS domain-containing protein [Rhizobiales bacterium L72]|uniref:SIS domain-containing protein n=2 Tax=Propylenella binzhouense TaxID=2555902 RepID=A0A964T2U3_9HYPH|nr:SIS domain-containing protein [Propylenella binzhouense]